MNRVEGTLEMYVGAPVTPWIQMNPPMKWSEEVPDGKTAEQVIAEHFPKGSWERLVDWKIVVGMEK